MSSWPKHSANLVHTLKNNSWECASLRWTNLAARDQNNFGVVSYFSQLVRSKEERVLIVVFCQGQCGLRYIFSFSHTEDYSMRLPLVLLFAAIMFTAVACEQKATQNQSNMTTLKTVEDPFPFILGDEDGQLFIVAPIESDTLFDMYVPLFEKYGYSGNGYSWEGNIQQILEKLDKELLAHIEFGAEAGAFFANADSKESQQRFVNILSPIFADLSQLEAYLKKADRGRISD